MEGWINRHSVRQAVTSPDTARLLGTRTSSDLDVAWLRSGVSRVQAMMTFGGFACAAWLDRSEALSGDFEGRLSARPQLDFFVYPHGFLVIRLQRPGSGLWLGAWAGEVMQRHRCGYFFFFFVFFSLCHSFLSSRLGSICSILSAVFGVYSCCRARVLYSFRRLEGSRMICFAVFFLSLFQCPILFCILSRILSPALSLFLLSASPKGNAVRSTGWQPGGGIPPHLVARLARRGGQVGRVGRPVKRSTSPFCGAERVGTTKRDGRIGEGCVWLWCMVRECAIGPKCEGGRGG